MFLFVYLVEVFAKNKCSSFFHIFLKKNLFFKKKRYYLKVLLQTKLNFSLPWYHKSYISSCLYQVVFLAECAA